MSLRSVPPLIRLREYARAHPVLFSPIWKRREDPAYPDRRVMRREDDIVIEGFPRSANTFATEAFALAQHDQVRIASHLHSPAQIALAHRYGRPAIVVIRAPRDALISWLIFDHDPDIPSAIYRYIHFHETLITHHWPYVLSPFEQTTTDLGAAVLRVNRQWGTHFKLPVAALDNTNRILERMQEKHAERLTAGLTDQAELTLRSTSPSEEKAALRAQASAALENPSYSDLLDRAKRCYDAMIARADVV